MRARLSTFALVTALLYIATVIVLLVAISSGMNSPHAVGALGAALAAVATVIGLFAGYRTARTPDSAATEEAATALTARRSPFEAPSPMAHAPPPAAPPAPESSEVRVATLPGDAPAPAPASHEAAATAILLREQIDAIPIGFATLDRDLIIRAANPALEELLHVQQRGSLVGLALRETALGAAIYSGASARLSGLALADFAGTALGSGEPLEVTRLLVPGNGHGWVARLSARLQGWPPTDDEPECVYLWVQPEATFRVIREPAQERADAPAAAPGAPAAARVAANEAATIAALDDAGTADDAEKLHEIGVRLRLVATTARALRIALRGPGDSASIAESDLRTLAELMMIEIQADRIGQSLGLFRGLSPGGAPPAKTA